MSAGIHDVPTGLAPLTPPEQWLAERARHAAAELHDCVEINPQKLGGVPVVKGSRITVAQLLAEIGEGRSAATVAEDFDLDAELVRKLVAGLAACLDRPMGK